MASLWPESLKQEILQFSHLWADGVERWRVTKPSAGTEDGAGSKVAMSRVYLISHTVITNLAPWFPPSSILKVTLILQEVVVFTEWKVNC